MINSELNKRPEWWKILTTMRIAIILLITLGILASLGTLIPQGAPADFYLQYYGPYLGRLILFFILDQMYSSWWFLGLGALFSLNLLLCSIRRIKSLKHIRDAGSVFLHLSILIILWIQ